MTAPPSDRLAILVASAAGGDTDAFSQILGATSGMVGAEQRRQTKALLRKIGMDVHTDRARLERDWASASDATPVSPAKAARDDRIFPDIENDCGTS